jgi:hypothetical protein
MRDKEFEKRAWAGMALALVALMAAILPPRALAQLSMTTIQGTVYRADGTPASGTLLISWSAFTTPQNQAIAAGSLSAPIGRDGFVSVNLTPNAAALPTGSYYTAVYHLNDGTVNQEYWVVPASGTASIGSVRAQLQPSTVAVQPVSKTYVDSAISSLNGSWLPAAGGTMTGPLLLSGDPAASNQAATKHYADQIAAQSLPLAGGTVTGTLNARKVEGAIYADQWQSGAGNNGIALSLAECQNYSYACQVIAPALYAQVEVPPWGGWMQFTSSHFAQGPTASVTGPACVLDQRWGWSMQCTPAPAPSWVQYGNTRFSMGPSITLDTISGPQGVSPHAAPALLLNHTVFFGSRNFNGDLAGGQTNLAALFANLTNYAPGSVNAVGTAVNCESTGDCIGMYSFQSVSGGITAGDNEGVEQRFAMFEAPDVFQATLNSVTTASAGTTVPCTGPCNVLNVTQTQGTSGSLGAERAVIDLTRGDSSGYVSLISNNQITSTGADWDTAYGTSSAHTTTTAAIRETGANTVFPEANAVVPVASAAGFVASKPACIFDGTGTNWECQQVTAVDSQNNNITFAVVNVPHESGSVVAQGGMAGMGLAFSADTVGPNAMNGMYPGADSTLSNTVRSVTPVMYNAPGGVLYLLTGTRKGFNIGSTRAYAQMGSGGTVMATLSGGAVTSCWGSGGSGYSSWTDASGYMSDPPQLSYTVNPGATPPQLVLTGTGSGGSLSGCKVLSAGSGITSISIAVTPTNGYTVYPMARSFSVWNPNTGKVDGSSIATDQLMPDPAYFHNGDKIEQPHYFAAEYSGLAEHLVTYQMDRVGHTGRYVTFGGALGTNDYADWLQNGNQPTLYNGYPAGSTPWIPGLGQMGTPYGYVLSGSWRSGVALRMPAYGGNGGSLTGALVIGCSDQVNGINVCGKWKSWSQVITHQNANNNGVAEDVIDYNPTTFTWQQTAGASGTAGANAACTTTLAGNAGGGYSISCGGHTAKFDASGNLSVSGAVQAEGPVTGATINNEVTVDGITYPTLASAWNAAVSQANATARNQTVRLGPGTYSVTATLTEPGNGACVSLLGSAGTTLQADSAQVATTLSVPSGLSGDVFYLGNAAQAQGCTFKDLNILAQGNATHAFELQWFRGLLVDNVTVNDTTAEGILLGESSTAAGHQSAFLLRNVTVSYSSAAFTPASRPAFGIHLQKTAMDSHLDDIVVRNALTAGVYNEGTGNTGYLIHGFGYPYTCTTAPCANNVSSGSAANASYATSYVIYDTGGAGSVWTDTYADSPAVAGFYIGANGVAIHGGHIQWPDLASFPAANLAYVASAVTNNLLIADVGCLGMAAGVNWITYAATAGNPPSYASVHHLTGCGNYYQSLEPANVTGFSSGGANINDPSGAVPRVWSTPVASAASYPAYSAQLYTGYQGDVLQAHFSGVNPFFNITYQGTIRSNGGLALSTVINTAAALTLTAANKNVIANAAGGAQTLTLPSCFTALPDRAAPTGLEFTIVKSDTSSNAVTLQTVSGQTINYNGAPAQTLVIGSAGRRTLLCGPDYNWYAF